MLTPQFPANPKTVIPAKAGIHAEHARRALRLNCAASAFLGAF
jgi:hypothetical protein